MPNSSVAQPSTTVTGTVVGPEPTGVPGIDDADAFCASWVRYSGSVQAVAIAAAFGGVDGLALARLEVLSAPAQLAAIDGIAAAWPSALEGEREVVQADLVGPFARRAQKAIDALRSAGASDAQLDALALHWLDALRVRDAGDPGGQGPPLTPT
ncbi:MAG TPA: hypothetical protein DCR14_11395, partial [Acidimicrobiaceae bacterium]|nr:hypothetical protein [Acidimicrobiaceae bacterium]